MKGDHPGQNWESKNRRGKKKVERVKRHLAGPKTGTEKPEKDQMDGLRFERVSLCPKHRNHCPFATMGAPLSGDKHMLHNITPPMETRLKFAQEVLIEMIGIMENKGTPK